MTEAAPAAPAAKPVPLSPAERTWLTRRRRKKGLFCLTIELRTREVDVFVRCGRLKSDERASLPAIKNAVYSVLGEFVLSRTELRAIARQRNET